VKEIRGFLKISRSYPIVALDFFRSLEIIRGIDDSKASNSGKKFYSLQILENENLARLFPVRKNGSTVQIWQQTAGQGRQKGNAFIHYNGKLCRYGNYKKSAFF
jgi:hypothetical protein